jgi:hypothetical protein
MNSDDVAPGSCLRLARMLVGQNELRRSSDRIEGALLTLVLAGFIAAVTVGSLLGVHVYRSQRARAAATFPVVAVLSQNGPGYGEAGYGHAAARWRDPRGRERSGLLTAPGIWNAAAGARIRIWVTGSGAPVAPPGQGAMICNAVLWACAIPGGAGLVLIACYGLCRRTLDRRRLDSWGTAWASTEPRWSGLR